MSYYVEFRGRDIGRPLRDYTGRTKVVGSDITFIDGT